ncbi:MAG: amidohydrolase family protein [Acidobacteria bacterium]|nr:amidohydrolase family protein [Acidobacteriota bacterium]
MTSPPYIILRGGTIVDGTGARPFLGDVAISGALIVSVGNDKSSGLSTAGKAEAEIIECKGQIVAPGFIDAHSHSDLQILENRTEKLLQGVTAEVVGNCGFSAYPLPNEPQTLRDFANGILCGNNSWGWRSASDYLASARESSVAAVVSLVGHGSLRIKVAGNTTRAFNSRELDRMVSLLDEQLQEGATGLSSGLMYAPGSGASAEELTSLCRVVARRGGVYATHMRSYSAGLLQAVNEQISIAEAAECRLQISHLQAAGEDHWPLQQRAIAAIEHALARGVDVGFDAYPWLAGSTVLTQVLPQSALEGGISELLSRLRDPVQRESIRYEVRPEARWSGVVITSVAHNSASLVGRSIEEIADERRIEPESAVLELLLEQEGDVMIVEHCQSMENLRALLTHPLATVVTDGVYTRGRSHPRLYGTFPLLLGDIVRKRKWLSLEVAVHKITGKPATIFHLKERGRIAPGHVADITVFDPDSINTAASYEMPEIAPSGIRSVWREGKMVMNNGVAS